MRVRLVLGCAGIPAAAMVAMEERQVLLISRREAAMVARVISYYSFRQTALERSVVPMTEISAAAMVDLLTAAMGLVLVGLPCGCWR